MNSQATTHDSYKIRLLISCICIILSALIHQNYIPSYSISYEFTYARPVCTGFCFLLEMRMPGNGGGSQIWGYLQGKFGRLLSLTLFKSKSTLKYRIPNTYLVNYDFAAILEVRRCDQNYCPVTKKWPQGLQYLSIYLKNTY